MKYIISAIIFIVLPCIMCIIYDIGVTDGKKKILDNMYYSKSVWYQRNKPLKTLRKDHNDICPVCGYVVNNMCPKQNYCDRCGQKLR